MTKEERKKQSVEAK